jgi:hypothetical protein
MLRTAPGAALLAAAVLLVAPLGGGAGDALVSGERRALRPDLLPPPRHARSSSRRSPRLLDLSNRQSRADWVSQTHITDDTERISADANQALIAETMELAKAATRYDKLTLPDDLRRKLTLLKLAAIPLPAPADPKLQAELTQITKWMEGTYGKGKYCRGANGTDCLGRQRGHEDHGGEPQLRRAARRLARLACDLAAHEGRSTSASWCSPTRARATSATRTSAPTGGSNYDMPADAFSAELDRLWAQVRPLYEALHAHVRASAGQGLSGQGPGARPHSRASPGQHLGPAVGKHLSAGRRARRRPRLRPHRAAQGQEGRRKGDGALRRALLHRRSVSSRLPRRSGSALCSSSRATARWSATPAPGTWTTTRTCASRCASR